MQKILNTTEPKCTFLMTCFFFSFNPPRRQPDNREQVQQNGEEEACLAVLNNFYGDGKEK